MVDIENVFEFDSMKYFFTNSYEKILLKMTMCAGKWETVVTFTPVVCVGIYYTFLVIGIHWCLEKFHAYNIYMIKTDL